MFIVTLICPIFHLGIRVICDVSNTVNLFNCRGETAAVRFSKWLDTCFQKLSEEEKIIIGISRRDIGTHSFRKGAATFIDGMSEAKTSALFQRAGWTLGDTQRRYIFPTEGSDQIIGRILCGLSPKEREFCLLPPHFINHDGIEMSIWDTIIPFHDKYPACFKKAIPFLVANVLHNLDYITLNFPPNHPVFNSRLFKMLRPEHMQMLKSKVVTGYLACEHTRMIASGIPETTVLLISMKEVKDALEQVRMSNIQLREDIHRNIEAMVINLKNEFPNLIVEVILDRIKIDGAREVTKEMLENALTQIKVHFNEVMHSFLNRFNSNVK